jgi:23S rRNA-/tRNA-specific pseudouridylate synthase
MKISELIIFENDDLIALNKPSGLLSIPDRKGIEVSLKVLLKEKYGNIFTVHRLDKETSGLIVFAKNEITHKHLSLQFENRQTKKIYQGLAIGSPMEQKGSITSPGSQWNHDGSSQGKRITDRLRSAGRFWHLFLAAVPDTYRQDTPDQGAHERNGAPGSL